MENFQSMLLLDNMWDKFGSRVKRICNYFGITKIKMADDIGATQSSLSTVDNGKQHNIDAYRILIAYPQISARWLLFGIGSMLEPQYISEDDADYPAINKQGDSATPKQPTYRTPATQPTSQPSVSVIDESNIYRYLYEQKDRECQQHLIEIGRLREQLQRMANKLPPDQRPNITPYPDTTNNNV